MYESKLATRATRLAAALVDAMLTFFIWFVVVTRGLETIVKLNLINVSHWGDDRAVFVLYLANLLFLCVLFCLMNGATLYLSGQTLGKLLLNIKIVRADGSRCTLSRLLLRRYFPTLLALSALLFGGLVTVLALVFLVVGHLSILSRARRTLLDEAADTMVVNS
jgi:uncharacterized RDD family membrane protein YckC